MLTPINQIAAVIATAFFDIRASNDPTHPEDWIERAQPYLDIMLDLDTLEGFWGIDPRADIVVKFLEASNDWTGALATHVRRQLRQHLKEANANH